MKPRTSSNKNTEPFKKYVGSVAVAAWQDQFGAKGAMQETQLAHRSVLPRLAMAAGVALVIVTVAFATFHYVAGGSLAAITLGTTPIRATDSEAEIIGKLKPSIAAYKLTLKYPDKTTAQFTASETGVSADLSASAIHAKRQLNSSLPRLLQWWKPIHVSLVTKTDKVVLANFTRTYTDRVVVEPKNANLTISSGRVVLASDVTGSEIRLEHAQDVITDSVASLDSKPLAVKQHVLPAKVQVKDLKPSKELAENILKQPVSFVISGRKVTPSTEEVASWIELSQVQKDNLVDVTVNSGKVQAYITNITRSYTRPARNRTVINTATEQIVLDGGATGYDVINKDTAAASVTKALTNQTPATAELTVRSIAPKTVAAPSYTKWIIADVTNKRMYAYEGANLVKSFLISAGAPATPTVIGQYKITRKFVSQDMYGANADGSRYFQPKVPYVSYFYGGYAIHGNYWRPADWFGRINSSHGCLGVTVADSAWLYNWAPVGTTVITHR
jgi:lipoprotein-anchoring transpeptidase ErfK/SrfK